MKNVNIFIGIIGVFLSVKVSFTQQMPMFRTEIYAPHYHNPASFGTWNKFSANSSFAISSFNSDLLFYETSLSVENSISLNQNKIGLGLNTNYESNPFSNHLLISAPLNYQLNFTKSKLSFGISPGVKYVNFHFNNLDSISEPSIQEIIGTQTKFVLNTGLFYYTDKFYAGFSIGQIEAAYFDQINFKNARHYFFTSGYRFIASKNLQLFPSLIIASPAGFMYANFKLMAQFIKPAFTLGAGYVYKGGIQAFVGYDYKKFSILYSPSINVIQSGFNFIHHELRLSFRIKDKLKCSTCELF